MDRKYGYMANTVCSAAAIEKTSAHKCASTPAECGSSVFPVRVSSQFLSDVWYCATPPTGFASSILKADQQEIIVTGTAQATMTDAEVKSFSVPLNFGEVPIEIQQVNSRSGDVAGKKGSQTGREEADPVAALREFTVVQGWWDTHVWILKQELRLDDALKDPRPPGQRLGSSGRVEAVVVAIQEGSESSRLGAGRVGLQHALCITLDDPGFCIVRQGFLHYWFSSTIASPPHFGCLAAL